MEENLSEMSLEKLLRKRDQAWECAGCARHDGDAVDAARWTNKAREYTREITERTHG